MPPAAVVFSKTECPIVNMFPPVPHVGGGFVITGHFDVLIGGMPAATLGSEVFCLGPIPHGSRIVLGSFNVLIKGRPAARLGDMTDLANFIVEGVLNVDIG